MEDDPQPNATFAQVDADGALVALVFDNGGLPDGDTLVALPEDYWSRHYRWQDGAFVADVEGARAALWEKVKAKRFAVEEGGCPTPLGPMDSDPVSQQKINGAVTMYMVAAGAGQPFSIDWTMADNSTVTHDGPAIVAAGVAMGTHVATCHAVAIALRAQIAACTTFEGLDAIDIEGAPWPPNRSAANA